MLAGPTRGPVGAPQGLRAPLDPSCQLGIADAGGQIHRKLYAFSKAYRNPGVYRHSFVTETKSL